MTDAAHQGPVSGSSSTEQRFRREKRHSRNVRWLKLALPALAVLMTLGLVGKSVIASMGEVRIDLLNSTIEGGKLVMANPHVEGVNSQNRRYEIRAARAVQSITNDKRVDLSDISVRLPMGTDQWVDIAAPVGVMWRSANTLNLTKPIDIRTTDGIVARLGWGNLDMSTGDFEAKASVKVERDGSSVTSDKLQVTQGGTVLTFMNNVKVSIRPGQMKAAPATNGESNGGQ